MGTLGRLKPVKRAPKKAPKGPPDAKFASKSKKRIIRPIRMNKEDPFFARI